MSLERSLDGSRIHKTYSSGFDGQNHCHLGHGLSSSRPPLSRAEILAKLQQDRVRKAARFRPEHRVGIAFIRLNCERRLERTMEITSTVANLAFYDELGSPHLFLEQHSWLPFLAGADAQSQALCKARIEA